MLSRCAAFIIVTYVLVSAPVASGQSCSQPLLVVGQDGRVSAGSKEKLRSAVKMGLPLRIGWSIDFDSDGKPDLSHWADAVFITEFEGEVFTQIVEIRRQMPKRGAGHIELSGTPQRWTGSIGSNGFLEGAFDDDQKPTRLRVRAIWRIDPRVLCESLPASMLRRKSGKRAEIGYASGRDERSAKMPCASARRMVYRHDTDGAPVAGAKSALFDAIRSGAQIRFAWGMKRESGGAIISVEHSAEPVFLTIMGGKEVMVQLPELITWRSYVDPSRAAFESPAVMWLGLMSTDGAFDPVWVNRAAGEGVRRVPQRIGLA
jgi:hypothetical protein